MQKLNDLIIWKKSIKLSSIIYNLTKSFPVEEKFGIISQMRRAAISIPSNIAEGAGREHPKEFLHFLSISNGSSFELQTQIILSEMLGYTNEEKKEEVLILIDEIQKMNFGLTLKIKKGI